MDRTTADAATLSRRPPKRFWGWGLRGDALDDGERRAVQSTLRRLDCGAPAQPEPRIDEFALQAPRIVAPAALQSIVSTTPYDRLTHAGGKGYADLARMWLRSAPSAPDAVAFPHDEAEVAALLAWAGEHGVAVVPFGGGTSVVGGVAPAVGDGYAGTLSIDLERFDRVLEIDATSRAVRIECGILGPDLEAALRPHGLTLRHFPQSFAFSTLGGWIATRAGGHYAMQHTHIDDFVESLRLVAPAGTLETRRLPASGAGPAPDRLLIGSEGTLGIVTQAWMRLQARPRFRAAASVRFDAYGRAVAALRALSQSGLQPSNARLLDAAEVASARVGDGRSPTLVIGFESADHPLQPWIGRALELMADHGGRWDAEAVSSTPAAGDAPAPAPDATARGWRDAFLRMPYWRDEMVRHGAIVDTFESAVTWDRCAAFDAGVRADVGDAIARITGQPAALSCRITHVYPDGLAPYFTYVARGSARGDLADALARWREIKQACNDAVIRHGGTSTHHHAVGRDHRGPYEREVPALLRHAFAAAKAALDPHGILNPGVLFAAPSRSTASTNLPA